MTLQERLATVLDDILPIQREDDGALTVHHDETFASLRVVTIAEGLDMVSLTQVLAWDLPVDAKTRNNVARHARDTLLGTVSLIEKSARAKGNSKKAGDVLLRYNFPAAGLTDDALRTLILLVLGTGSDIREQSRGLSLGSWLFRPCPLSGLITPDICGRSTR